MKFPFSASTDSISVFINGTVRVIPSTDAGYPELLEELKKPDHDAATIEALIDKPTMLAKKSFGMVTVTDDVVYYKDEPVDNSLSYKLLTLLREGFDIKPWALFMDNLMQNPSYRSREALFNFLEHFQAPITEDGCFITFKRVNRSFKDIRTGKFDNSPGTVVKMDRALVDDDSQRTCSAGLHVCADEYLDHYATSHLNKTVVCKVNPKDVVAVPYDYNFAKMRVCEYTVLAEVNGKERIQEINNMEVYEIDEYYDDEWTAFDWNDEDGEY